MFFCSLTWLTPGFRDSLAVLPDDEDEDEDEDEHCHHEEDFTPGRRVKERAEPVLNSGGAVGVQSGLLLDHKFSIIKHDNDSFQIVQGYMAHLADDGGAADAAYLYGQLGRAVVATPAQPAVAPAPLQGRFSTAGFTPGAGCAGFGLIGWQQDTAAGARLGAGFSRERMASSLLPSLRGFAENDSFDARG